MQVRLKMKANDDKFVQMDILALWIVNALMMMHNCTKTKLT